jgi:ubiquinone/menaquinone biosynthesis C-methylase UbiE
MSYLETTAQLYAEAAETPQIGLCCISAPPLQLPGLQVPAIMHDMNYGCGSTVHPAELVNQPTVLYIGVGGGLEALQFAYFGPRRAGSVIAVDPVPEMRQAARANLRLAALENDWFEADYVQILAGDALALPMPDASVDVVAQNCLFNIFEPDDLRQALREADRVLKPGGRLLMSDPITNQAMPERLRQDERLRAMCLSGALTYEEYTQFIVDAGFGQIEVRARRPYRLLDAHRYDLPKAILLESLDTVSFKLPVPADGACIFTGKTASYIGPAEFMDDQAGHILQPGLPLAICDKTAASFAQMPDVFLTDSTWHYTGGGCC